MKTVNHSHDQCLILAIGSLTFLPYYYYTLLYDNWRFFIIRWDIGMYEQ
jgi:hypothetical protein